MAKPDMSVSTVFNTVAQPGKIVSMKEHKQKYLEIVAKELTFWEKTRRFFSKPKSALRGLSFGVKLGLNKDLQDMFRDANPDGTIGAYKNKLTGESFMSTGFAASFIKFSEIRDPKEANSPFSLKLTDIYARALNACEDHAERVRSDRMFKPTF